MQEVDKQNLNVLIIAGPTASGKSALALELADNFKGQIINADVGQFYTKFEIGTAKPDLKNEKIPHHLFDVIDTPQSISVCSYRKLLLKKVEQVQQAGSLPIIVGGSLFYLKSIFFPPIIQEESFFEGLNSDNVVTDLKGLSPWDFLNEIDPQRAADLNPADLYRVNRAISLWSKTKKKPSELKPKIDFPFNFFILYLNPEKNLLEKRIRLRTYEMILPSGDKKSWIDEVRGIVGTPWEEFLKEKKLIGYPQILEWLKKEDVDIDNLIDEIVIKTKNYAKRQGVFWKSFKRDIEREILNSKFKCKLLEIENINLNSQNIALIRDNIADFWGFSKRHS